MTRQKLIIKLTMMAILFLVLCPTTLLADTPDTPPDSEEPAVTPPFRHAKLYIKAIGDDDDDTPFCKTQGQEADANQAPYPCNISPSRLFNIEFAQMVLIRVACRLYR
ncbi:MAG: hypothetical protein GY835_15180 [bacterium]|nr:hypothetical protein [bacterium]